MEANETSICGDNGALTSGPPNSGETMLAKDLGNEAFLKGDVKKAMEHWNRGVRTCQYVLAKDVYEGEQKKIIQKLLCVLYVNLGAAYLKLHEYYSCLNVCNNALKLDSGCVKALYRKADSLFHLCRYTEAIHTLNILLSSHSDNVPARLLKSKCQQVLCSSRAKERKIMQKIFQNLSESLETTASNSFVKWSWSCSRHSVSALKRKWIYFKNVLKQTFNYAFLIPGNLEHLLFNLSHSGFFAKR